MSAAGGFLCIARDLFRRATLLLDRGSDRSRDLADVLDDPTDILDGFDGAICRLLDSSELAGNIIRRLARLPCERFHFGSDHGEAFAGFARTRGLNGRIERKQIGLGGDVIDRSRPCHRGAAHREVVQLCTPLNGSTVPEPNVASWHLR